ncbi:hypothetical protein MG293_018737 [Ovis ammon polii]|nr:hypothetical protein MG293_018737 [Ovis ammon polii]KAI4552601.1 hypothetical protein MJT46_017252 [Ovis ammon polii x Ovis aries]
MEMRRDETLGITLGVSTARVLRLCVQDLWSSAAPTTVQRHSVSLWSILAVPEYENLTDSGSDDPLKWRKDLKTIRNGGPVRKNRQANYYKMVAARAVRSRRAFGAVPKKKSALFEVSEVIPVMTNNYEENILKGVRDSSYSLESSIELLQKDVVQLHAPRYQSMRRDVIGCTQEMDFILWPRNDIEKIVCLLFSRWKESDEPFRPVQAKFEFHHGDYEKQFLHVLSRKDKTGIVVNNPNQSVFLFIDRQHLQTPKNKATIFKLCSICLYLPQEQLTHWAVGTIEDHLHPYMPE